MPQPENKVTEYLETVRRQIRWKRAQKSVLEEINDHITDQKNAFLDDGLSEDEATEKAILEMGDPVAVGEQLDRAHRPKPDWALLSVTALLVLLGITIQFWIGPNRNYNGAEMFHKQILWAGIGLLVMVAAYFLDFTIVGKFPRMVFLVLCVVTLVRYWFIAYDKLPQTSTFFLLLFPTALAGLVYSMRNQGYGGLILCALASVLPAYITTNLALIFLAAAACFIILMAAVLKGWFKVRKAWTVVFLTFFSAAVIFAAFYVTGRIEAMMNPNPSLMVVIRPEGDTYTHIEPHTFEPMTIQFITHARFIGMGLSLAYFGHVPPVLTSPAANIDLVLTNLIYGLGWIALVGLILILAVLIVRGIRLCKKQGGMLGFLVSVAVVSTIALQAVVYIVFNLGFFLIPPVSLPLISYGGQALITNLFLIGLLLSVSRTGDLVKEKAVDIAVQGEIKVKNSLPRAGVVAAIGLLLLTIGWANYMEWSHYIKM